MGVFGCAACGYIVNDQATRCPDCGADPHTGERNRDTASGVVFASARYLGHHPEMQKGRDPQREGKLRVAPEWIGLEGADGRGREGATVPLSAVASVEVLGGRVAKRAGDMAKDALASGAIAGVAGVAFAGYRTDRTTLVLRLKSGEAAYFEVDDQRAGSLRVAIAPVLTAAGVPFFDDATLDAATEGAPGGGVYSAADELLKLVKLRDSGELTQAEFATLKARLIG